MNVVTIIGFSLQESLLNGCTYCTGTVQWKYFLDRHSTAEPEVREAEEVKFKEVSEAYSILIDIKKRRRYDTGQDLEDGMGFGMGKCVCVCV